MSGIDVDAIIYDEYAAENDDPCADCCPCCHPCHPDYCPDHPDYDHDA